MKTENYIKNKRLISDLIKKGYKINQRTFSDITPLFSNSYKKFDFGYKDNEIMYFGAEHSPKNLFNKLPNLTFFNKDSGFNKIRNYGKL